MGLAMYEMNAFFVRVLEIFPYATIDMVDGELIISTGLEQKDTGQILPIEPDERGDGW